MTERIPISKRLRFEIFKRDGFVCQYCGRHPPDATLHADHINPVANGGTNAPTNLITACETCNQGKGAVLLTVVPLSLTEKTALLAEREAQIAGYYAIREATRERLDEETWRVIRIFRPEADEFPSAAYNSIQNFLKQLSVFDVMDAAETAMSRQCRGGEDGMFRYFCGICWAWIKTGVTPTTGHKGGDSEN